MRFVGYFSDNDFFKKSNFFLLQHLVCLVFFCSTGWCYENHNNNVWKLYFVSSVAKKNGKFYRHVASNLGCHEKILSETLIINLNWSCKLILQINRTKFDVALDPLSCTTTVGLFLLLSLFCKQWISNNRSCNKEHCLECYGVSVRYFVDNNWNGSDICNSWILYTTTLRFLAM